MASSAKASWTCVFTGWGKVQLRGDVPVGRAPGDQMEDPQFGPVGLSQPAFYPGMGDDARSTPNRRSARSDPWDADLNGRRP